MKISPLVLGVAVSLAALPALAQTGGTGAATSPGTGTSMPNAPANSPSQPPSSNSTGVTNEQAPPATGTGTRALTPGQNPDGTPRSSSPSGSPQLPGMKGQGN